MYGLNLSVDPLGKGSPIGVLSRVCESKPLFPWFSVTITGATRSDRADVFTLMQNGRQSPEDTLVAEFICRSLVATTWLFLLLQKLRCSPASC